jgi:nitrite reductase (NO-forming)
VAAIASTALPADVRRGPWLPLHLALAGGASTAIAGVMPFFAAALAAAPPVDPRLRTGGVVAVATGAATLAVTLALGLPVVAAGAGVAYLGGIALVAVATALPPRRGLGPSRGIVTRGYLLALANVAIGASLATAFLAGWTAVAEGWAWTRATHAWLNLVGFVSLSIATTLLHFFPTVVGARIAGHRSATVTVVGIGLGAPVTAIGFLLALDAAVRVGAVVAATGAAGLAWYAVRIWRTRARWTTDAGWHRFTTGGLVAAIAWFIAAIVVLAGRTVLLGADPGAWSFAVVGVPLVAGWVGLAILASATHLLPAVGPGHPEAHRRQRRLLGQAAVVRLGLLDVGVAALWIGLAADLPSAATVGAGLAAIGLGMTVVLLGVAVAIGRSPGPVRGPVR